jgi:hypothetical protein
MTTQQQQQQTGLTTYTETVARANDELNRLLMNKVDVSHFKRELLGLAKSIQQVKIDIQQGIEIDHHDEHVLKHLYKIDQQMEGLATRILTMESNHQIFQQSVLEKINSLEKKTNANETNGFKLSTNTNKSIESLEIKIDQLMKELRELHNDHHEHKSNLKEYNDTELREVQANLLSTTDDINMKQMELTSLIKKLEDQINNVKINVREFYDESTQIHRRNKQEEVHAALRLRDDLKHRVSKLQELLNHVMESSKKIGKNPSISANETPESCLHQIGTIASSLRSVIIPTLAEFRTKADSATADSTLRLVKHGVSQLENNVNSNNNNDVDDDTNSTNQIINQLIQSVNALKASRSEVSNMVTDLSTNIMDAWISCQKKIRANIIPLAIPRPTTPSSKPLTVSPNKYKRTLNNSIPTGVTNNDSTNNTNSKPARMSVDTSDVRNIVDMALNGLKKAMNERATKTMLAVVQEQSLAQIDTLRDEMSTIDRMSRRSDLLQKALDDQARDLSKVYDYLMNVAKNGGETNAIVAELRFRIDETTENVAQIVSDKARVDRLQYKLLNKTNSTAKNTKATDKRLSYMMGSFMNKVEQQMTTIKRDNGNATNELKRRFAKELRRSINNVTTKLSGLENDVKMIHPLVNTDVASYCGTSLVLASRCMSCDRPVAGANNKITRFAVGEEEIDSLTLPRKSLNGAFQGSLLLTPGNGPPSISPCRSSETRGGGFRVGAGNLSPGGGMLWVGGENSPTGIVRPSTSSGRPATSMGLRKKRY